MLLQSFLQPHHPTGEHLFKLLYHPPLFIASFLTKSLKKYNQIQQHESWHLIYLLVIKKNCSVYILERGSHECELSLIIESSNLIEGFYEL